MKAKYKATPYGEMTHDFKCDSLSTLCLKDGIQTGPFGSQLHQEDYVPVGTPIITVEHLRENRILHIDLPRVSEQDYKRLSRYVLREGDIVFSRVGSVDRRAYVTRAENGWLFSGRCLRVRPNSALIDSRFLSYFFGLSSFKEYIRRIAVGATMPSLNTQILSSVPIYYPPLPEQKAIASILGALDDKIELNRKMNETLEAMARAMFKSWFVDFDPIPGLGPHKEWQDSPLGRIPKGWRVNMVADVVKLSRDVINPSNFPDETFEHYSIPAYDEGGMPTHDLGSTIMSNKFLLSTDCILLSKLNPRILRVWFPKEDKQRRSVASTEFLVLVPKIPCKSEFIYSFCISSPFQDAFKSLVTGTSSSHQRVKPDDFLAIQIICPPDLVLQRFTEKVEPLFDQVKSNKEQSHTLAAIRDALLPKLLSGEIRVKDAERFLEEVV